MNLYKLNNIADFLEIWLNDNALPENEQKIFDNYYRSYKKNFGKYIKKNYCLQTKDLINIISKLETPKILEVGSGCGTESLWAAMQGSDVTGIDIDDDLLLVAQTRKTILEKAIGHKISCEFKKCAVLDLEEENKYDIIWMEQTFHHLEPRAKVINKLSKLVKKGGYIIISETNAWNPLNQLFFFKVRGFKTIIRNLGHEWGNERITTPEIISKEFKKRGVKKIGKHYFRTLPNFYIANYIGFLDKIIPQFLTPFFTHYNYVGRKM